jgi:tRNA pseudouridine55 synthase
MAALRRTATGNFTLTDCHTLEALEAMDMTARLSLLRPTESLFADLAAIHLPPFYARLCKSGCEIYQQKIGTDYPLGTRVRLYDENAIFFALGEVRDYENGTAVKAIKTFELP